MLIDSKRHLSNRWWIHLLLYKNHQNLNSQKRQADEELGALRERNREDLEEIDRLNVANE